MISAGETFVWRGNARREHLYIAMNDSDQTGGKIAVLNLTESVGGAASFVLKAKCHSYIYKDSDVNFGDAFIADESLLREEIKRRSAIPHDPMDLKILREIAERAVKHPAVAGEVKNMIKAHWRL